MTSPHRADPLPPPASAQHAPSTVWTHTSAARQPRRMPLDAWLAEAPESSAGPGHLPEVRTALRDMAWNYGQVRGLAAVCVGSGSVALAGAALAAVRGAPTTALWLLLAAALQLLLGACVGRSRAIRDLPATDLTMTRGPVTLRSGLGHALVLAGALSVPLAVITATMLDDGIGGIATAVTLHVLLVAEVAAVFALPAVFAQHAQRDFRTALVTDPRRHQAADLMAAQWQDPRGFREFGPL